MNLHEYQARDILRRHGIPVPPGDVATTPQNPRDRGATGREGGRESAGACRRTREGGGVKLAKTAAEAEAHAKAILA